MVLYYVKIYINYVTMRQAVFKNNIRTNTMGKKIEIFANISKHKLRNGSKLR